MCCAEVYRMIRVHPSRQFRIQLYPGRSLIETHGCPCLVCPVQKPNAGPQALVPRHSKPPGAFQHQQGGVEGLELVPTPRDHADLVGDGSALPGGAQSPVSLGFGNSNTATAGPITHAARLSARPCRYGLHGTTHLFGLGEARTSPHAPLRSQGSTAQAVSHGRDLGDRDAPTSLL